MITSDAVASLRPRPFGPPLRGRAPRTDGIIMGRPLGPSEHEERNRRFHLKIVDQWSDNGGRRTPWLGCSFAYSLKALIIEESLASFNILETGEFSTDELSH